MQDRRSPRRFDAVTLFGPRHRFQSANDNWRAAWRPDPDFICVRKETPGRGHYTAVSASSTATATA